MTFVSWVSSLAYPNSLETKGYVVVVVVVILKFKVFVTHTKKEILMEDLYFLLEITSVKNL